MGASQNALKREPQVGSVVVVEYGGEGTAWDSIIEGEGLAGDGRNT